MACTWDWNTIWTAVGAIATVAAVFTIYLGARQLQFDAWLKAQEIFVADEFTKARSRMFNHVENPNLEWSVRDEQDGLLICRRLDEFCRLAPYFAFRAYKADEKVLAIWAHPIGNLWGMLKDLVMAERDKTEWNDKWDALERLGDLALQRLPEKRRELLRAIADSLRPEVIRLRKLPYAEKQRLLESLSPNNRSERTGA